MNIRHLISATNPGWGILRRVSLPTLGGLALAAALAGCGGSGMTTNTGTTNTSTTTTTTTVVVPKTFTSIDGPNGGMTTINGIQNLGAVAGFTTKNGINFNFIRSSTGVFTPENLLGDPAAMLNDINTNGGAVGVADNMAFSINANNGVISIPPPNSTASVAFGINGSGVIVGQYTNANKVSPGFVDVQGAFTTIMPTQASMVVNPQSINTAGLVVGFYSEDGVHQHGFTYNVGTAKIAILPDPSTARTQAGGLVLTQFLGVNDKNVAVGYYQTNNGSQFGFLFNLTTNTYTFLDEPNAAPVGGVQITQITGINNNNEICGFYIDSAGVQHGFTAM